MAEPFTLFVGSSFIVMALVLAGIQRSSNVFSDIDLPLGFNLPLLVAFAGAGFYIFRTEGITGIFSEISKIIFFSVVTILFVRNYLRGEEDATL